MQGMFGNKQPIGSLYRSLCIRGLRRIRSPPVSVNDLSNPKPGHSPGGSIRGGVRRDGGAERGRAAQNVDDGIVRRVEKQTLLLAKRSSRRWIDLLGVPLEARTREILYKPIGNKTRSRTAAYSWLSPRQEALFVSLADDQSITPTSRKKKKKKKT